MVVARIAAEAGLPPTALDTASAAEVKEAVRMHNTAEAVALGVFGVPTMAVGAETFWGCDSLPHLERYLRGADPVPPELVERWERLPAGARRRGGGG